jgi:hypothetical protein
MEIKASKMINYLSKEVKYSNQQSVNTVFGEQIPYMMTTY